MSLTQAKAHEQRTDRWPQDDDQRSPRPTGPRAQALSRLVIKPQTSITALALRLILCCEPANEFTVRASCKSPLTNPERLKKLIQFFSVLLWFFGVSVIITVRRTHHRDTENKEPTQGFKPGHHQKSASGNQIKNVRHQEHYQRRAGQHAFQSGYFSLSQHLLKEFVGLIRHPLP